MSGPSTYVPKSAIGRWFESRLPLLGLVHSSFIAYPVPRNLNYMWTFGAILSFMLVAQILTGVVLAMHYVPSATEAFSSVNDKIMRDVNYGWMIRYMHSNGASLFFLAGYIHMFRGLYYGSFKPPRELLWIIGVIIYFLMMATAFMGYVLPWGSMSFAGATVITNLTSAIPLVGNSIAHWLWGGFAVGGPTLNRFFSLHYLLPFIIAAFVGLHIWALHVAGQNNPDGVEVKDVERDTVAFTPYATIKDAFGLSVFLILYAWLVFYIPNYLLDADNSNIANPLATPAHVVPEWYLLPFYAMLRAIPNKLMGVIVLFSAIVVLAFIPWLDRSPVKSAKYRPAYRFFFWVFVLIGIGLGLSRFAGANGGAGVDRAHLHIRLFRLLPHYHARSQLYREDEADPDVDRRRGARQDKDRGGHGRLMRDRSQGSSTMIRVKFSALALAALALVAAGAVAAVAQDEADQPKPPRQDWSFSGMFGIYDRAQLQRGFQVYKEVCSTCHALSIPFRTLADPGGPGFTEDQVKTLAATYQVTNAEPNEKGDIFKRPATPADVIPRPEAYPNDQAAAAALGKAPPDMALSPRR